MTTTSDYKRSLKGEFERELYSNWQWLMEVGALLTLLGLITAIDISLTRLSPTEVIGSVFTFVSIVMLVHAVKFWRNEPVGLCLHLIASLLYGAIAAMVFMNVQSGMLLLIDILAVFYVAIGLYRIRMAIAEGLAQMGWSWTLLNGVINLVLAIAIWLSSQITLNLLGAIAATDIFFTGLALLVSGAYIYKAHRV